MRGFYLLTRRHPIGRDGRRAWSCWRRSGLALLLWPAVATAQPLCADLQLAERRAPLPEQADNLLRVDAQSVDLRAYGLSRLSGGVRLRQGSNVLIADHVEYDEPTGHLRAPAPTFFETEAIQVSAESAEILVDQNLARFRGAEYVTFVAQARGRADELTVRGDGRAKLENVRYTTCPEDSEDWVLEGEEIKLDSARGRGSAKNVRLRFKGVPLFWAPLFYFPVGDQRQTGILPPRLGDSDTGGLDLSIPLYINLAANYDMTLTPRHMADRGNQIQSEFRYLWQHGSGRSAVEFLHRDERTREARHLVHAEYSGGSGEHWTWNALYFRVSDTAYLTDLNSPEADPAQSQLPQSLRLSYRRADLGLQAELGAQDFQPLTQNLAADEQPFARLPEANVQWQAAYRNGRVRPGLDLNAVQFRRDDTVEGWRGNAQLNLDWRYDTPQAFLTSHADYRWTAYDLEEPGGAERRLDRELPTLQAGAGLRFVRADGDGSRQTLTPQINYLYVPFRDQQRLPVFDTSLPDFSFDQLFAFNRFTGPDRIADANLVTTALRSDWYEDHGRQRRLTAKLGVQLRLSDSRVSLPGDSGIESGSSDWLGELDWSLRRDLRIYLAGQWNDDERRFDQSAAALRYQPEPRSFAQVAYRFRRENFEQADAQLAWPLSNRWRFAGRWTYAVEENRTLESLGGLEYRSCCWAVQVAWRRHLTGEGGRFDSSIFLQLELNGLGKVGRGLDSLLDRDIL